MSVELGSLIRVVSTGLRVAAVCLEKVASLCESARITVSWEFALVLLYLTVHRRWGCIAIAVTLAFIIAYERGSGNHFSFGWVELLSNALAQSDGEAYFITPH